MPILLTVHTHTPPIVSIAISTDKEISGTFDKSSYYCEHLISHEYVEIT